MCTREAYGKALVELGETNDKVLVLDADLAAATKTGMFKSIPEKFIDVGIAESNLMGVAAGLAATGHIVFASSLLCLPPAVRLNRCAIPLLTPT